MAIMMALVLLVPLIDARVDAVFTIWDENGRQIYMRTPDGKIIYGNVLVGQRIKFDASKSNSKYPIDTYFWDFDGDGKYDKIVSTPVVYHVYNKPGTYNAKLLAKASSAPPAGDGDVVFHKIVVVDHFIKPVGKFEIEKKNATYLFNASKSYDPDGYVRSYSWDFDGDGKFDFSSFEPEAEWTYGSNGYYVVKLQVMDYDMQKNESMRVIKVDDLQGEINESDGKLEIINRCDENVEVNLTINNWKSERIMLAKGEKYVLDTPLSPDYNEVALTACGNSRVIVFEGTHATIEIDEKGIHLPSNSSPGFELIILLLAILFLIMGRKQ